MGYDSLAPGDFQAQRQQTSSPLYTQDIHCTIRGYITTVRKFSEFTQIIQNQIFSYYMTLQHIFANQSNISHDTDMSTDRIAYPKIPPSIILGGAWGAIVISKRMYHREFIYTNDASDREYMRINLWLSILAKTGGVVGLMLGSVFIIELDAGLAGIFFHRYCTVYDVCQKQNKKMAIRS